MFATYQLLMTVFTGKFTSLAEHLGNYADARTISTSAIRLWPKTEALDDMFLTCSVKEVLLTSHFLPIDTGRGLMFLDQSYSGVIGMFPVRFETVGDGYRLESDPVISPGRHVVIGGPVDLVWYHWLFSWAPRLLLVKSSLPDLFEAEDVRFVVHPNAMRQPYRAILDTFGLDEKRFLIVDPERDYRFEEATLVTFPDQNKLYPALIEEFGEHLRKAFCLVVGTLRGGVFASRQGLPPTKRRVANFSEIEPVLEAFGIQPVSLGQLAAAEQAQLFHGATIVVGAHGSDLSNILFCRPGTPVVVIENQFSVDHNLHIGLLKLAEVLGLQYHLVESATTDESTQGRSTMQMINRDYVVDPARLEQILSEVIMSIGHESPGLI